MLTARQIGITLYCVERCIRYFYITQSDESLRRRIAMLITSTARTEFLWRTAIVTIADPKCVLKLMAGMRLIVGRSSFFTPGNVNKSTAAVSNSTGPD